MINFFKKKRKVVSLIELHDKVGKFAAEHGQTYFQTSIKVLTSGSTKKPEITLRGYVNGFSHVEGLTIEEVIDKLDKYKASAVSEFEDANIAI